MGAPENSGSDWAASDIDLIVADYFEMLRLEALGEGFNKAARNRNLQKQIGRSASAIEWKHRNISAVLEKLCEPRIRGYAPAANYQRALLDRIEQHIDERSDLFDWNDEKIGGLTEATELFIEHPPDLNVTTADKSETEPLKRLIRKFDPAARDAYNRKLGELGEERVVRAEEARLINVGRKDLARKVKWISKLEGDGAGFDVLSYTERGEERLLEVKTTMGPQRTPFFLTENERKVSEERPKEFRLMRLYDFHRSPRAFELVPPLIDSVILRPQTYSASFG